MVSSDQKRAILAVFLSGIVLFVWQTYFAPVPIVSQPEALQKAVGIVQGESSISNSSGDIQKDTVAANTNENLEANGNSVSEITLNANGHVATFNSQIQLKDFINTNQVSTLEDTAGKKAPLRLMVDNGTGLKIYPNFSIKQAGANRFTGEDVNNGLNLAGSLNDQGKLTFLLTSSKPVKYRFQFDAVAKTTEDNRMRELVAYTTSADRTAIGEETKDELQLKWVGLDFNYHFLGLVLSKVATSNLVMSESAASYVDLIEPVNSLEFEVIYTKKEYDHLKSLGSNLQNSVDFGFFGIVAVFILSGIQKVYDLIPNYGFAIIIVTFLIRFVLFPLQYKSIKSMKNMQKIQPEIKKIKEKFKDDQARIQKETMELFKRSGANPLGGCLPMLLQMPVFFAFYQVLYNAVELVDAPFMFWLTDLSVKDPYYVLPVLVGVTFLAQTKLNPTPTADPMQAKMMMLMPVVFSFIMKDLPAGLNLYFTTSTLFGIVQQLVVYRFIK